VRKFPLRTHVRAENRARNSSRKNPVHIIGNWGCAFLVQYIGTHITLSATLKSTGMSVRYKQAAFMQ
jgi:hypothetical protein